VSGALSASRSFSKEDLEEILARDLLYRYGPLLGQDELWRALGYMSLDGLRQAQARGTVPVHVFSLERRRGKFALSRNVAHWLASQFLAPDQAVPT